MTGKSHAYHLPTLVLILCKMTWVCCVHILLHYIHVEYCFNRSFAVFNVVHPATHMFVSKTIPLSPLDTHILLPPKTLFKPTSNAELSIALRVSKELQCVGKDDANSTYTVELLYHVSDFFGSTNIDYFLTTAYFIPHVVAKIMQVL